jgi:hypothetical protein
MSEEMFVCICVDDFLFLFSKREARAHNLLKGICADGREQEDCAGEKQMWTKVLFNVQRGV